MYSVTSQKLRSGGRALVPPRTVRGYLLVRPTVGNTMVLFREDQGSRMVTTAVTRVRTADGMLFVETENSTYRIEVHGRVVYSEHEAKVIPLKPREVSRSAEIATASDSELITVTGGQR